ncbi:Serine/threonine phosphatase [Handroanthus impetiginosus]|uniref:Serine/threonine phosphatase n=1 Tax=Handroanthus impetiginosus TaxID=429701 RepID=A0A2G9HPZ1_9LAMI|nr:Serine/threonine phosphatase [Handroanthus impetiginosus]
MGAGFSQVFPCFNPAAGPSRSEPDVIFTANAPLDETLGHSFCYVRSSARFISPTHSDRFVSPSQSLRFDDPAHPRPSKQPGYPETGFRAISGASVSANTSTPITVLQLDDGLEDTTDAANHGNTANSSSSKGFVAGPPRGCGNNVLLEGFESTSSFSALPLQRVPRGGEPPSGPMERAFFMSGPIERGALSGPLDATASGDNNGGVPFSAPLGGMYVKKRKKKSISGIRKALYRNFSVVPVRNFISGGGRKDVQPGDDSCREAAEVGCESNVQWALGKAGEDRVHVVVSEELGWLFVGIYDGFNGPDAPEFLMSHLYKAMYKELEGLFWDTEDVVSASENADAAENSHPPDINTDERQDFEERKEGGTESQVVKKVMFGGEQIEVRRRRLWEYLVEDDPEDGLDLSGSERFAFSVDDALSVNNAGSAGSRRSLLLSKLKHGLLNRHKDKESIRLFPWRFWLEGKQKAVEEMRESNIAGDGSVDRERTSRTGRKRKVGLVDHELVLSAMSKALEVTEQAYLDMTDRVLDRYPELALMGSCLLVVLMRDEDVYVMNVGDSRAIVAQYESDEVSCGTEWQVHGDDGFNGEGIVEESAGVSDREGKAVNETYPHQSVSLTALQLSTDHSTSIEEEVIRIKNEHPDDKNCIVNDRVKGRLKVTRAFGAGFLKQDKWNDALLEMFRNDYIGTAPYISCSPSLRHHKLCPRDQFLVLSSDGLYQYFSNQEVVSHVQNFMERFPDGDPAQHLIEELLFRAARKAGMDFHELLDIPQGDRRKYHDDVTVMVVSLEGRIWKSSGKYL